MTNNTIICPENRAPVCSLPKVQPYKTLECMDYNFVFDTTTGQFFKIDPCTKAFLDLCLDMPIDQAKSSMLKDGTYSNAEIDSVETEVKILEEQGLFKTPDYSISPAHMERELKHRYTSPWNKLELALAESCNLACTYCYCATCRDMPNQGLMIETVARQAITWLFAVSGKSEQVSITFFGGEPLMNKPVFTFAMEYSQHLAKLHGKKVFYSMTTNGTLLDDAIINYIKKYNFGLMVSMDGPEDIHNKQCPTQEGVGSFELAKTGIKKLMKRRGRVTVRATMTHPVPNMLKLINFFEDFGFSRIVIGRTVNPVNPSPVDCTEEDFVELERQEREEIIPWVLDKLVAGETPKYFPYSSFFHKMETGEHTTKVSLFKCGACRGTTTVGADGRLYPCHRFVGMEKWIIGDVANGPNIEKCKQFWRDYRAAISESCESCWIWTQCKGPCPWEIAQADGTFAAPRHCDFIKNHAAVSAYVYSRKEVLCKTKSAETLCKQEV